MRDRGRQFLFLLLILLPIAEFPGVTGISQWILMNFAVAVSIAMFIPFVLMYGKDPVPRTPVFLLIIAELFSYLLSLLNGVDSPNVLMYPAIRQLLIYIGGYLLFYYVVISLKGRVDVFKIIRIMLYISIGIAIYTFAQLFILPHMILSENNEWLNLGDTPWWMRNPNGTLTNRNIYAFYLNLIIVLSFVIFSSGHKKLGIISIISNFIILILLKGIAASATIFIIILSYSLFRPWTKTFYIKTTFIIVILLSSAVGFFMALASQNIISSDTQILVDAYLQGNEQSIEDRIASYQKGIELFTGHPLIGAGIDSGRHFNYTLSGGGWAENMYILKLSETGIIGFIILLLLYATFFTRALQLYLMTSHPALKNFARAIIAAIIGNMAFGIFETAHVISPQVNMIWWGLMGFVEVLLAEEISNSRTYLIPRA